MLEHGGNLLAAAAEFALPLRDLLDLSTGINPSAYPVPPMGAEIWQRLPEVSPEFLNAARSYYAAPDLLAVAGSQAAIQALPRLRQQMQGHAKVAVMAAAYAEHAQQWRNAGHAVQLLDELDGAVETADVVVVCNPNNPTGERISVERLLAWHARVHARGGWLVVDEAFADMLSEHSLAAYTAQPGLIVLRSFGKFFGLAGLRLGFVLAEAKFLHALATELGPWSVTAHAQMLATQAFQDSSWQTQMRLQLAQQGARLRSLLAAQGWQGSGTDLFHWISHANLHGQTEAIWRHCAQAGIWVRKFDDARAGLRFGLPGSETEWARLAQALESFYVE